MKGKVLALVLCAVVLSACVDLGQAPQGAAAGSAAGAGSAARGGMEQTVDSRSQTGPSRPVLKTYTSFDAFGVKILKAPDGLVTGSAEVLFSSREKIDLAASLVDASTGKSAGIYEYREVESGWYVGAGFAQGGVYKLSVFGKPASSTENSYKGLFELTFTVKVDPSTWALAPSFGGLGLSLVSTPGTNVTSDARIVVSMNQPDVTLSCGLSDPVTGMPYSESVSTTREGGNTVFTCLFPQDGSYAVNLWAYQKGRSMGLAVARTVFTVRLKESPADSLVKAVKSANLAMMRKALDAGADPNTPMPAYLSWELDGVRTSIDGYPIFQVLQWYSAAVPVKVEALTLLKTHGADFTRTRSDGITILDAFFSALPQGGEDCLTLCKALLDLGADPRQDTAYTYSLNNVLTKTKVGTILALCRYGDKDAARRAALIPMLAKRGASLTSVWPGGDSGLSRLIDGYGAASKIYVRAYLDAGADPSPDDLRRLAWEVRYSTFDGDWDFVSRVISRSTHLNDRDEYGSTIVHNLVDSKDVTRDALKKFLAILVSRSADLNASTKYGETPLMTALEKRNTAAVDELLAAGADPRRSGTLGRNVFSPIVSGLFDAGTPALIDRFLALGADINARDYEGRTPLFLACESDRNIELLKLLVSKGADPMISDVDGFTAMGYAKSKGFKTLVAYLTTLKVPEASGGWPVGNTAPACAAVLSGDLAAIAALPASELEARSARTLDGVPATPLHLAAETGGAKLIEALSARKVRWDTGDRYGRTPLEKAVLLGREEAVRALLAAGSDPMHTNDWGETPISRAIASGSSLAPLLLAAAKPARWDGICVPMAVSSPLSLIKANPRAVWDTYSLNVCAMLGRADVIEHLGQAARHESLTPKELLDQAMKSKKVFDDYSLKAGLPPAVPRVEGAFSEKKGTYTLTLKSWSPWMDVDPALNLSRYPVTVFVPKDYDGAQPYGLVISMMNAQSASQAPSAAYVTTLEKHRLIWVGFDPYNGVFEKGSSDFQFTNHERLCLAAVYQMFGAYRIDRSRVYLTGFSWGGRLTGEIVPKQPGIFTGGIAVGGCFTTLTGGKIIPSYPYAKEHVTMVCATGDWDYNRDETSSGYNTFLTLGYEAYYIQEPRKGHARISGENFEKAVALLDAGAARREAGK